MDESNLKPVKEKKVKQPAEHKPRVKKYNFKYLVNGNHMVCASCGRHVATRPDVYQKRLDKVGGDESKLAEYQCMRCRPKPVKVPKEKKVKAPKEPATQ